MYRLHFKKGLLRQFITEAQNKLNVNAVELSKNLGVSGRTINDWKREKFKPNSVILEKLSTITGIPIPKHKILNKYWYVKKGASEGGIKRYQLYGAPGNIESRRKGGQISWLKRKNNLILLKKYMNTFSKPKESVKLAEYFGIILGDGSIHKDQCVIYLNSKTDKQYALFTQNLIRSLFKLPVSLRKANSDNVLRVSISGINVVKYLVSKGLRVGNKVLLQVDVPDWILKKNEYIKACIRGLIDTDGCFAIHRYKVNGKEYQYPKICFSNKSEPLLDFVYQELKKLGYNPKRTVDFDVWLHNQNEVKKYLKEIGTRNIKPNVAKIIGGLPEW